MIKVDIDHIIKNHVAGEESLAILRRSRRDAPTLFNGSKEAYIAELRKSVGQKGFAKFIEDGLQRGLTGRHPYETTFGRQRMRIWVNFGNGTSESETAGALIVEIFHAFSHLDARFPRAW